MEDGNLYDIIKGRNGIALPPNRIRMILSQVLRGLSFMHSRGVFHRDIKPENLLMRGNVCKVADFGLAKEIRTLPPLTKYVSTRWYRAPEVLLRASRYSAPIDLFAVGCIMVEMYNLCPLFPGETEIDQITKIFGVLGTPTQETWMEGVQLAMKMNLRFLEAPLRAMSLHSIILNASPQSIELLGDLLKLDPHKRVTAAKALEYDYFKPTRILPSNPIQSSRQFQDNNNGLRNTKSYPSFQVQNSNKRSRNQFSNHMTGFQNASMDISPFRQPKEIIRRSSYPMPRHSLLNTLQSKQIQKNAPAFSSRISSSQFGRLSSSTKNIHQTMNINNPRSMLSPVGNFIVSSSSSSSLSQDEINEEEGEVSQIKIYGQCGAATRRESITRKRVLTPPSANIKAVPRLPDWSSHWKSSQENESLSHFSTSSSKPLKSLGISNNFSKTLSPTFPKNAFDCFMHQNSPKSDNELAYFSNIKTLRSMSKAQGFLPSMLTPVDAHCSTDFRLDKPSNIQYLGKFNESEESDSDIFRFPPSHLGFGRRRFHRP